MMNRLLYSILLFSSIITLLYVSKNKIMFKQDGNLKEFGFENGKTLYSFGLSTVIIAYISVYVMTSLEIILAESK